ncbi:hypothetical protein ACIG47_06455 [Promicromonospora sp. NPDC052451]|uniref:hypothetical protein n=1 Tax=Promicromonospora sp. NPDC052451 TaxID=3364407 RepID=UPI0037CC51A5
MSDEPTRRIPPAADPTQIQRPPARTGRPDAQPDAPSSYAAPHRTEVFPAGRSGQGAAPQAATGYDQTQVMGPGTAGYDDRTQVVTPGTTGYDDRTQAMPPTQGGGYADHAQGGSYGDATQVLPPSGAADAPGVAGQGRDFRAATPPPAQPYRPYETAQPTQVHGAGPFPGEPGAGQGGYGQPTQVYGRPAAGYGQQQAPGYPQPTAGYGQQQGQGYPQAPHAYGRQPGTGYDQDQQGYAPQPSGPTPPAPRRDRDDDSRPGGSAAGAVLAWIPRLLLVLSVYQLVRLVPGFDVMPDVAQFPLFRGIGDGVLGMLNLNPEWSDQAANLTIPVLGMALAGVFNTIRALSTSLAVWPYGVAVFAWIVVFAVGGIVGYAQDAAENARQNIERSVDEGIEDAKQDAEDTAREELEKSVDDARQDATDSIEESVTEQLQDALPGGEG